MSGTIRSGFGQSLTSLLNQQQRKGTDDAATGVKKSAPMHRGLAKVAFEALWVDLIFSVPGIMMLVFPRIPEAYFYLRPYICFESVFLCYTL